MLGYGIKLVSVIHLVIACLYSPPTMSRISFFLLNLNVGRPFFSVSAQTITYRGHDNACSLGKSVESLHPGLHLLNLHFHEFSVDGVLQLFLNASIKVVGEF